MKNYQLNNTSVYLGGQCGWDIVISNKDDELFVSEFQLSPLSDNIPFNKKAHSYSINNNHSDNIKQFYSDIKENFWYTQPNINKYSRFDGSYMRGMSRLPEYGVYEKQFKMLVPLWLECIKKIDDLKFEFVFFDVKKDGSRGQQLDSSILTLNKKDMDFHDKFIQYFSDWLTYLNIIPNPGRYQTEENENLGNDKILNISLKENTATIDGVFVSTGQRSGEVSVDYLVDNLLSIERPNMDADYLISSVFQSHDIIASQLFNLCFCFNLDDVISPFLCNLMMGKYITGECNVYINDKLIETKDLFTNYEYIPKTFVEPFLITNENANLINDTTGDIPESNILTKYQLNDEYINLNELKKKNVLDYLLDYSDKKLKYINKLNQHVFHWGYTDVMDKTFNLYDGYKGIYVDYGDNLIMELDDEQQPLYKINSYDITASNSLSITEFPDIYTEGNNSLSWLCPGKILYIGYKNCPVRYIRNTSKFLNTHITGLIIHEKKYKDLFFSKSKCINYWDSTKPINELDDKFLCVYIDNNNADLADYFEDNTILFNETILKYTDDNNKYLLIGYERENGFYTIISNDLSHFVLNNLISILKNDDVQLTIIDALNRCGLDIDILDYFNQTKNIILQSNNGEYYKFGQDIGVFEDDLLQQTYYKLNSQKTFVYRQSGNLTPLFSNTYKNYKYFLDIDNNSIIKSDYEGNQEHPELAKLGITPVYDIPETIWLNGGWHLVLSNKLNFKFIVDITEEDRPTLKQLIKSKVKDIYNINDLKMVDYIYGLYNVQYKFEYVSETDINNIEYTIKMTLK